MGVMEPGTDRSGGKSKEVGDLRGLVAHVVTEHEDRALVGGEPTEPAVELVAIGQGQEIVRCGRVVEREHVEVRDPPALPPGFGDADVREESVDPGVEAVRIAEVRQVPPGDHQRVLQGILGPIDIPEDPIRDRVEAIAPRPDQVDECRLISSLGRLDEVAIHRLLPCGRPSGTPSTSIGQSDGLGVGNPRLPRPRIDASWPRSGRRRRLEGMRSAVIALLAVGVALVTSGCSGPVTGTGSVSSPTVAPTATTGAPSEEPAMRFTLTSTAFSEGGSIPRIHTCDGDDVSPPLAWSGAPDGTASLALIVDDPDAGGFVHWVAHAIDPVAGSLPEGVSGVAGGLAEGRNGFGDVGYGGPCPPSGTHRYAFRLLALDVAPTLTDAPTADAVRAAAASHTVGEATLTGTYRRGG